MMIGKGAQINAIGEINKHIIFCTESNSFPWKYEQKVNRAVLREPVVQFQNTNYEGK